MSPLPARRIFEALAILFILLAMAWQPAEAQDDDVKYCQDLVTGEIKVVKAGMPCPYPMAEM
jgi:hypothetical protein